MKKTTIKIVENPDAIEDRNYNFWTEPVLADGVKIGELNCTDIFFPYCQINGSFDKKAHWVKVEGTEIQFQTAISSLEGVDEITLAEFIALFRF